MSEPELTDFPARTFDKLRYGDTDRQGHVNNAVFTTLFETGRAEVLQDTSIVALQPGQSFVIARLAVDFRAEIHWPGTVEIGTRVKAVGRSSITLVQGLFQHGKCVATAESVLVLVESTTRRSTPLDAQAKQNLLRYVLPDALPG